MGSSCRIFREEYLPRPCVCPVEPSLTHHPPVRIPETPPGTTFPTCHTRAGFSLANETPSEHLFGNAPFSLGLTSRSAQRHFVRSRTPASAARAPATTLGVSRAASLPPRLRIRPSTTTVST